MSRHREESWIERRRRQRADRRARESRVLRTDDRVTLAFPWLTRRRLQVIGAIGLIITTTAVALIAVAIDRRVQAAQARTGLTATEVQQLRSFIAQRGAERDAQAREFDARIDEQTKVLCLTLTRLIAVEQDPSKEQVLRQAETDLQCARVSSSATTSSASPTSLPTTATSSATLPAAPTAGGGARDGGGAVGLSTRSPQGGAGGTGGAGGAGGSGGSGGSGAGGSAGSTGPRGPAGPSGPAGPTGAPGTPAPTSTPSPTVTILDPVTTPICNLLGICL